MVDDDNTVFIDAENKFVKEELGFKELVFKHLSRITLICSAEFREGYWQKKPVSLSGGVYLSEIYVEDRRDAYINAIDCLHDILLPHFDKEMIAEDLVLEEDLIKDKNIYVKDKKPTEWINKKLIHKRKLFQKLNLLLKRLNYFDKGSGGGE